MKTTLYITVKVEVESKLDIENLIDEFGSESYYSFESTENITVLNTEYLNTSTEYDG